MNKLIYTSEKGDRFYYDFFNNKITTAPQPSQCAVKNEFPKMFTKENYTLNLSQTRQQLVLSVTENCNLRCTYCIYHDDRYTNEDWNNGSFYMSFEVAEKAINNFLNNSKKSKNRFISFYGGEPLVNFRLIKKCIEYVKKQPNTKDISFSMTTNGLLLRKNILKFLIENNVLLNVSIDGAKEIHDRYRVNARNNPSFDAIMENLIFIKKNHKVFFSKNITFTTVVAPPVEKEPLLDFLELFQQEVSLNDIDITQYMDAYMDKNEIPKILSLEDNISVEDYPKLLQSEKEKILKILGILKQGNNYSYIPGGYCRPLLKKTFVDTDGNYFLCEKFHQIENNRYGNVDVDVNVEKVLKLNSEVDKLINEKCRSCWANRFCDICYISLGDDITKKCESIQNESENILKLIVKNNLIMEEQI